MRHLGWALLVVLTSVACSRPGAKKSDAAAVTTVSSAAAVAVPSASAVGAPYGVDRFGRPLKHRAVEGQMKAGTVAIGRTDLVFTVPSDYVAIPIGEGASSWVVEPAIAPGEHEKHTGYKRAASIHVTPDPVPNLVDEIKDQCGKDKRALEKSTFLGGHLLRCDGPADFESSKTVHKHRLAIPLPDTYRSWSLRCESEAEDAETAKVASEICRSIRHK